MMSYVIHEPDRWSTDGARITAAENLQAIQKTLEDDDPIIVEHWFYPGSRGPDRFVFEDVEDFEEYLENKARVGDRIEVWNFAKVCTGESRLALRKCPGDQGWVPKRFVAVEVMWPRCPKVFLCASVVKNNR